MKKKMTKTDKEDLLYDLNEYLSMYLEFEDEEDFEEKYGPSNTIEDISDILHKYVDDAQDMLLFKKYMSKFPGSRDELMDIFGVDEADEEEDRPYTVWGRIGMSVSLTKAEYERLCELLKNDGDAAEMLVPLFRSRGVIDGESYIPGTFTEELGLEYADIELGSL